MRRIWIVSNMFVLIVKTPYILAIRLWFYVSSKWTIISSTIFSMIFNSKELIVLIMNFPLCEWKKKLPLLPAPLPDLKMFVMLSLRFIDSTISAFVIPSILSIFENFESWWLITYSFTFSKSFCTSFNNSLASCELICIIVFLQAIGWYSSWISLESFKLILFVSFYFLLL